MRRWLPTFRTYGACSSDSLGEDAEGWMLAIEWRGWIVEISLLRRGLRLDD